MFNKGDCVTWSSIDGTITYKGEFIKMVYHGDREFLQIQSKSTNRVEAVIHEIENTEENIFKLGLDNNSPVKIKVGQRYMFDNVNEYILCQVSPRKMCLIDMNSGNRWNDPVKVENSSNISPEEFKEICWARPHRFKLKGEV